MGVFAENSPGQFVGVGFADHGGPGVHQHLDHSGRLLRGPVGRLPVGIASARNMSGDIENILGGKAEADKRPAGGPFQEGLRIGAKGV